MKGNHLSQCKKEEEKRKLFHNQGFDKSDKIKTHIEKEHKDILIQIGKDINEDDESESDSSNDESYGEAWLAKYDSDGNFTG